MTFTWTAPAPAEDASLAELFAEVRAFSLLMDSHQEEISVDQRKRADLRERASIPRRRHVITDEREARVKLGLETGFDARHGRFLRAPLEPWTGPPGSMELYADLMRGRASSLLEDYGGSDLAMVEYLLDEQLAGLQRPDPDSGIRIVPLSDGQGDKGRRYPGAPVSDSKAGIGKQLRGELHGITLASVVNLCAGRSVRRGRRAGKGARLACLAADDVPIVAAQVAAEANAIKARRPDLEEYRWASVSRVREIIRDLVRSGVIEEARPPKAVRQERSWRTLPRLIRRLASPVLPTESPP